MCKHKRVYVSKVMCFARVDHPLYLSQVGGGLGGVSTELGWREADTHVAARVSEQGKLRGLFLQAQLTTLDLNHTLLGGGGGMTMSAERLTVGSRPCVTACVTGERRGQRCSHFNPSPLHHLLVCWVQHRLCSRGWWF
jgi:hypothetical protein